MGSWICAQHHLLEVPAGSRVFLSCANEVIDGRCYDNRSTFFSLVPGGQRNKIYIQNVHFCSLKIGLRVQDFSKVLRQKITKYLGNT